ncbi:LLM class flavin-dependent oxidoreductase (plasmid) [Paracoccus methylovorus]|uniref:LLM class flavin-dependent oxidoreductase n=1 Tax=Paracoccus methylovorus TaxID=2812658 RepID=A0ABX7JQM7_9RHOB|nr:MULTISPECIES: LLM class flavin-dependent oxidoreductase [Paracoccus]QRZ16220.1 LLM class flavin-dependent oxidoreductase [Paracoccus methylovorus]
MSVEFIGFIGNHNASEIIPRRGPVIDRDFVRASAAIHEAGGFDRVLLAFHSSTPDSLFVGQYVASVTSRLKLMLAHRPGFTAPTLAARQLATLDHLTDGRVAVHIITGGNDRELEQDGDWLTKDERYARTREYLDIVRQEWTSETPFDYRGDYYRVKGALADIRPKGPEGVPVYFGGSSPAAIDVAGQHADVYALWGETYEQVAQTIAAVRASAARHGRNPRFSLSLRPILAETEDAAWAKAARILEQAKALRAAGDEPRLVNTLNPDQPQNEGSRRLLAAAARGARLDKRLWTEIAALTGANGNSTSLVGTPDQVADAMLDYYRLGISTFLIRGFDPLPDALQYGRDLIPRVRARVAAEFTSSHAAE